jgi:U6 snRNA-associated Sm-like protein LSm7
VGARVCVVARFCSRLVSTDDEGNESTRSLGLIVARGTLLVLISPIDGSEEIANPFVQAEDE